MKARAWLVAASALVLVLSLLGTSAAAPPAASEAAIEKAGTGNPELDRILKGFKIAPVPLNMRNKNKDLVGLGSYIVNAQGGCNDCHTNPPYAPGGDPFQGEPKQINAEHYLAGGQAFGPFISANITPNADGLPHGLTLKEFKFVLRHGHEPGEPDEILQVMPWPVYGEMTDRDLAAVYEFLRSIPHAEPGP
jgi:hypothetical protein